MKTRGTRWKVIVMLIIFLMLTAMATANAQMNSFLVKAADGTFYEYNSADLNNSYLISQLNPGSDGSKMYVHFANQLGNGGHVIGLGDTQKGYMDYTHTAQVLLQYQMTGQTFDINTYFASDDAVVLAETVTTVKIVDKDGNVDGGEPTVNDYTLKTSQNEFLTSSSSGTIQFTVSVPDGADSVSLMTDTDVFKISMLDDGIYSVSGDDLPGDEVYSCKFDMDLSHEAEYNYYAQVVQNGQTKKTETVSVKVITALTEVEVANMSAVEAPITTMVQSDSFQNLSLEERANQVVDLLKTFDEATIKSDSISVDLENKIVTYEYSSGVSAGIMLEGFNDSPSSTDLATNEVTSEISTSSVTENNNNFFPEANREFTEDLSEVTPIDSPDQLDADILTNEDSDTEIGKALILYAFGMDANNSWRYPYYTAEKTTLDNLGLTTTIDSAVTVQDFKDNLDDNYDVISFSMHGSYYTNKPVLCTNDTTSKDEDTTYSGDLKSKRIVKVTLADGLNYYWIMPDFFDAYYDSDSMEDTYIYMENCDGFGEKGTVDYSLADGLIENGAECVIGFHNSVLANYCRNMFFDTIDQLIQGKTAQEALDHAKATYGNTDGQALAAYPILWGDGSYTLVSSLKNGGFEDGTTLTAWNKTGDVRMLTKIGNLVPLEGKQMAFLSTGIGSQESQYLEGTEGSILSQSFLLPKNAKYISLNYDVISEEPMEWVGSSFDDEFSAELLGSNGATLAVLAGESINSSTWLPLDGINFDGGDNTTYHTGWTSILNYDISSYAGQNVTLRFRVSDKGDSIYDTAAIVDGISISN